LYSLSFLSICFIIFFIRAVSSLSQLVEVCT
jgi:hypothetical protein